MCGQMSLEPEILVVGSSTEIRVLLIVICAGNLRPIRFTARITVELCHEHGIFQVESYHSVGMELSSLSEKESR